MVTEPLSVAVTGLNATDNPGPGLGVLRALRDADPSTRLVGLAYDALDPALYAPEAGLDAAWMIPYPSQGAEPLMARLLEIHAQDRIDVVIPTLDAELPAFIALAPRLEAVGIRTFLPTRAQLDLRSKARLSELGARAGLDVPEARVLSEPGPLRTLHEELPYPLVVKGVFYGAQVVHGPDEAVAAFHATAARWGLPVIVQRFHAGEEYDVVAVGDGAGGLTGAVAMKKLLLTDKGKGWAGVAVRDERLLEAARIFMAATRWRGPCELEVLRTPAGRSLLIEVNPRFPAWSYLAAAAGQNLAWAVARLAMGEPVPPFASYRAGTMFVRVSVDRIARMEDFQSMATAGAFRRDGVGEAA